MDILSFLFETGFWIATVRMATPLIFGTLGELLCERAGVLNLGIEGIMAEAAIGQPYGATVAPHNWGSLLGYYCLLHLGKVIENWYMAEQDALSLASITPLGFEVKDGYTTVTEAPGLGLKVDVEAFMKEAEIVEDLKA